MPDWRHNMIVYGAPFPPRKRRAKTTETAMQEITNAMKEAKMSEHKVKPRVLKRWNDWRVVALVDANGRANWKLEARTTDALGKDAWVASMQDNPHKLAFEDMVKYLLEQSDVPVGDDE